MGDQKIPFWSKMTDSIMLVGTFGPHTAGNTRYTLTKLLSFFYKGIKILSSITHTYHTHTQTHTNVRRKMLG